MGKEHVLYVGSYTEGAEAGIHVYRKNPEGSWTFVCSGGGGVENPSYLAADTGGSYVYAVSETMTFQGRFGGSVAAFFVKGSELSLIGQVGTGGTLPCHVLLDEDRGFLFVSNYMSGSISMLTVLESGSPGELCGVWQHEGSGPDAERQEGPHVHFSGFSGDRTGIWCVDLGIDTVKYYRIDTEGARLVPEPERDIVLPAGTGPRHFVLHPGHKEILYLVCELSSQVFVVNCAGERADILQAVSTLEPGVEGSTCAALKISEDGRFLYVSNRGDDSIAVFAVDAETGLLKRIQIVGSGGAVPRDITLSGNTLLAANQETHVIAEFQAGDDGRLHEVGYLAECRTPVCLVCV